MGIQRDAAPTGLDLLLAGRVLQRWRAYGARGVGGNGLGITEISPLRGLGCFWWDAFYKDDAPTALALWGNGLGITEMPPLRGLICFWRDGFYRDGAPTALGVWEEMV